MMKHLREIDEADRTVIMVQVENEPGSLGSVRDFSPESNKLFAGPAPAKLVTALKKKPGTWKEAFGRDGRRGLQRLLPLRPTSMKWRRPASRSIRCPLTSTCGTAVTAPTTTGNASTVPARSYPSGGAVAHMLDLWKANAPAIDAIASDIYHQSPITYLKILNSYRRPDNPLLIVETGSGIAGRAFFYAMADFAAIGFAPFGVDGGGANLRPDMAAVAADFRLFKTAIPVIAGLAGHSALEGGGGRDRNRGAQPDFQRL